MPGYRVGNGYDVHRLTEGRKRIGRIEIPYKRIAGTFGCGCVFTQ